jgi:inorganic pyrophosphatase
VSPSHAAGNGVKQCCRTLPAMEVVAIVEIPRGSRNKYEADHDTGEIWLDRMLFTATQYPADYGYIPETLADDGDPLDILILLDEPTFPGCHIRARVIGVFRMRDEMGGDDKVLCVPATDPRWSHLSDLNDVGPFLLEEIAHFFAVYKQTEPGKDTEPGRWEGRDSAVRIVEQSFDAFRAPDPARGEPA